MELSVYEIRQRIHLVRGLQIVLDHDLADFFETKTKILNQAVNRNLNRFPADFRIHLTHEEKSGLPVHAKKSSIEVNRGGRTNLPYGFTQEGIAMLSGVLSNERAIQSNILVMRAFAESRRVSEAHLELVKRFDEFEIRCADQFKNFFDTLRYSPDILSDQIAPITARVPPSLSIRVLKAESTKLKGFKKRPNANKG